MKFKKVYEDSYVLIVNKPSGLVVNRSQTIRDETLQDQLSTYFGLTDLGIGDRAGIVHRLDRETSGLLIIAKQQKVFDFLQLQFKQRQVEKEYLALVHGHVKDDEGTIRGMIGRIGKFGKFGLVKVRQHSFALSPDTASNDNKALKGREAETGYVVIKRYSFKEESFEKLLERLNLNKNRINYFKINSNDFTYLAIKPKTGRTHQIRVHLKSIGYPVVGDDIYTSNKLLKFDKLWCSRLFLHASYIKFKILKSKSPSEFKSDLPNDLKNAILNSLEIRN